VDPKRVRILAIVVVVVLVVSGLSVYYVVTHRPSSCTLSSKNPLVFDQAEQPDSLDPAVAYTAPGWGIVQQAYQTLVMYNGSSDTQLQGVLAKNWSESTDGFHWNFTLWPGEHFSNGDPLNAYVVWYSINRGLVMNQAISILVDENFYSPGVSYYSPISAIQASNNSTERILSTFNTVANVTNPSSTTLAYVEAQNQSFRVINNLTIQVNLGFGYLGPIPYTFLLDQLAMPPFAAVDPLAVEANGGVQIATPNTWMAGNMMGSGPFVLSSYTPSTGYTLSPNSNYWGAALAAQEPWNNNLQPAKSSITVIYQGDPAIDLENLKTGSAAAASFAFLGPSTLSQLKGTPCIVVQSLPTVFGSTTFSSWIYMDQNAPPFNNLSVRASVAHAIDYGTIIQTAYGGNAAQWVGPVPPGYPDYNPGGLSPYAYNVPLAMQEMNNSPWPLSSGGYSKMTEQTLNFEYINVGTTLYDTALLIQSELAVVGIKLNLVGLDLGQLAQIQGHDPNTGACDSTESLYGGPFYIGEDYYTADYVSPDDATQALATGFAGFNVCQSEYNNATVNNLVVTAAGERNSTAASADYAQMTQIMYDNYSNAWLFVPTAFAVYNSQLQGLYTNPMGAGLPYVMEENTEYAS
jgi:peptide/nickel transport system substrate-binding protein